VTVNRHVHAVQITLDGRFGALWNFATPPPGLRRRDPRPPRQVRQAGPVTPAAPGTLPDRYALSEPRGESTPPAPSRGAGGRGADSADSPHGGRAGAAPGQALARPLRQYFGQVCVVGLAVRTSVAEEFGPPARGLLEVRQAHPRARTRVAMAVPELRRTRAADPGNADQGAGGARNDAASGPRAAWTSATRALPRAVLRRAARPTHALARGRAAPRSQVDGRATPAGCRPPAARRSAPRAGRHPAQLTGRDLEPGRRSAQRRGGTPRRPPVPLTATHLRPLPPQEHCRLTPRSNRRRQTARQARASVPQDDRRRGPAWQTAGAAQLER